MPDTSMCPPMYPSDNRNSVRHSALPRVYINAPAKSNWMVTFVVMVFFVMAYLTFDVMAFLTIVFLDHRVHRT